MQPVYATDERRDQSVYWEKHLRETKIFDEKMLRVVASRVASTACKALLPRNAVVVVGTQSVRASHGGPVETDEEFDERYTNFFNRKDIDHWEVRKALNDLAGELTLFYTSTAISILDKD